MIARQSITLNELKVKIGPHWKMCIKQSCLFLLTHWCTSPLDVRSDSEVLEVRNRKVLDKLHYSTETHFSNKART